ncbi:MAG: phosphoenolpyruvate-utilizing N-terminal domain-containing protein, partial [Burkholderiales bacterium]
MNFVLHGHAVSTGITIGYAHLVSTARLEVAHYEVPPEDLESEVERLDDALRRARQELDALKSQIAPDAPAEFGAFLDLHRMI